MTKEPNEESAELDTVDEPQSPAPTDEPEPEWQRARHEVQSQDLQAADENHPLNQARGGETGSISQKVEDEVMLDYISDKIYGGPEATVREYLANAETACVRAAEQVLREEMDLDDEDFLMEHPENPDVMVRKPAQEILDAAEKVGYNPTIQVEWHRDDDLLVIQDNGIGFTPREVTDIMAWAGRSGVRDRGDVSGQFGMGLMSWVKASDKKGAMTMTTRTRRTDVPEWAQESFGTYIKLTDQDPVDGMKLPEGQYGTRFEIPLDPDLQDEFGRRRDDNPVIRKWTIKYAENMRIPVTYDEYEDGETSFDEEFGGNALVEDYDGALLEMDRPGFYAACYPDSSNETLLLSMDIDRNGGNPRNAPWGIDVRFRNENGMIISGPNAGKTPVSEAEYEEVPEDRKNRFIREEDVEHDDITLPIPTADRDRLQRQSQGQFWDWLGEQFQEEYKELLKDVIDDVDGPDHLLKMAEDEPSRFSFLMTGLTNHRGYGNKTASQLQDRFESQLEHTFSEEECELLLKLLESISLAPRGRSGVRKKNRRTSEKVWRVHRQAVADGGNVFMGKSINEDRCEVVWHTHDSNQVVKIEQGESYKQWADTFGWRELKEVPLSLDDEDDDDVEFSIPDDFSNSQTSKSNAGKPPEDRDLTIRQGKGQKEARNYGVDEIEATLKEVHNSNSDNKGLKLSYSNYVDHIVLFPSDTDENVSEWYDLAWGDWAVATCIKKVYDYLKDVPGIMHIDDLIQDSMQVSLETNEGTKTVAEAGDRLLIHVVDEDYLERFRDDTVMQTLAEHLTDWVPKHEGDISYGYSTPEKVKEKGFIYAPVDIGAWRKLNAGNIETQTLVIGGHKKPRGGSYTYSFKSDVTLYAVGRLHEWDGADEVEAVKEVTDRNEPEVALSVVDTLAMLHDNGVQPHSVLDDNIEVEVTEKQQTLDDASDDTSDSVDEGNATPEHEVIAAQDDD